MGHSEQPPIQSDGWEVLMSVWGAMLPQHPQHQGPFRREKPGRALLDARKAPVMQADITEPSQALPAGVSVGECYRGRWHFTTYRATLQSSTALQPFMAPSS